MNEWPTRHFPTPETRTENTANFREGHRLIETRRFPPWPLHCLLSLTASAVQEINSQQFVRVDVPSRPPHWMFVIASAPISWAKNFIWSIADARVAGGSQILFWQEWPSTIPKTSALSSRRWVELRIYTFRTACFCSGGNSSSLTTGTKDPHPYSMNAMLPTSIRFNIQPSPHFKILDFTIASVR